MRAPLDRLFVCLRVEALGFEKIGIDEAREQHPDQKGLAEALVACPLRKKGRVERLPVRKRLGMILPARRVGRLRPQALIKFDAIGQPGMVTRYGESERA